MSSYWPCFALLLLVTYASGASFGERVQSFIDKFPLNEVVDGIKAKRHPMEIFDTIRYRYARRTDDAPISNFAKGIETFLSKLIPNQSAVQDIMGYVSRKHDRAKGWA